MDYTEKEIEITDRIQHPHLFCFGNVSDKKNSSYKILKEYDEKTILLMDPTSFLVNFILAGLNEKHIEHIAKNAPRDYKENILKALKKKEATTEIFEIAKAMDEDLEKNSIQNQKRVKNVIRYIKDNLPAFQF